MVDCFGTVAKRNQCWAWESCKILSWVFISRREVTHTGFGHSDTVQSPYWKKWKKQLFQLECSWRFADVSQCVDIQLWGRLQAPLIAKNKLPIPHPWLRILKLSSRCGGFALLPCQMLHLLFKGFEMSAVEEKIIYLFLYVILHTCYCLMGEVQ